MKSVLCIGCGDIGRRVGALYHGNHTHIEGWARSDESLHVGKEVGIQMQQIDLDTDYTLDEDSVDGRQIFWFAPPPKIGNTDTRIRHFLNKLKKPPAKIVLISTTGVYGDCGGRWVDEHEPQKPIASRALRRVDAEQALQDYCKNILTEWIILRVPGIYSEDRLPLARLKRGEPVVEPSAAAWSNRIHADDLAQACILAMQSSHSQSIYNISDNQPSTMTDYFNQVADYSGLPRPPQVSMEKAETKMSEAILSYLRESRRINNSKMRNELGVKLRFPTLKDCLKKRTPI